jgi:arabinogalactan endo-1,4-beta-galactosidase
MKKRHYLVNLLLLIFLLSCTKSEQENPTPKDDFIRAADVSILPTIEKTNTIFYNQNNQAENPLLTLKNAGCNTIRIRLWKNPASGASNFEEVKTFSDRVKQMGFKVWLTVHFSDTWADPGAQIVPAEWQNLSFDNLKVQLTAYTNLIMTQMKPDIFQLGNEINNGLIHPFGNIDSNYGQFLQILQTISSAVRQNSTQTKIMIHYAGIGNDATIFFNKTKTIDFDYIGLSYYPQWHGKNLNEVTSTINNLGQTFSKQVIIAETAYPFTLGYNDFTNNVLGLQSQIIPIYSASPNGQQDFLMQLKLNIKQSPFGKGFCYWEPCWTAFLGPTSTNGSPWENLALWDFNNKALNGISIYK